MASSGQTTVTSTRILIIDSYGAYRDVHLRNVGSHAMYCGGPNVTTSNGFVIPKDSYINFKVAPNSVIWAVTANNETGVASVLYMEP